MPLLENNSFLTVILFLYTIFLVFQMRLYANILLG